MSEFEREGIVIGLADDHTMIVANMNARVRKLNCLEVSGSEMQRIEASGLFTTREVLI
jgi:hypothetical protein